MKLHGTDHAFEHLAMAFEKEDFCYHAEGFPMGAPLPWCGVVTHPEAEPVDELGFAAWGCWAEHVAATCLRDLERMGIPDHEPGEVDRYWHLKVFPTGGWSITAWGKNAVPALAVA